MNQPLESYQDEIYLNGLGGATPPLPARLPALEELARERMAPESFDYICGGAGTEDSVRENLAAFGRWRIVPRMLTDVSAPSYASTVLGTRLDVPFLLGPVGVLRLAHPDGEVAVARAAAAAGVPMVLSTAASYPIEEVAAANGDGQRWFQLYWPKDRDLAASFLDRAAAAGFSVLVLTLDTRLLGYRPRDLDRAFLPFLRGIGNQNYFTDALDALPPIAAAVGSRLAVLFDSGIRGGADMVKALALGAQAVLIARPYAYALGLGGQDGVRHVLRALRQDFELTMRLSGFASLADLTPGAVVRRP